MASKKRGYETVRDMVVSMAVLAAGVALLLLVTWRPDQPNYTPVSPLDVSAVAQQDANFKLFIPDTPENWAATTAWIEPLSNSFDHWHMSYVIDENRYVGFEQTDGNEDLLLNPRIGQKLETVNVGLFTYDVYEGLNDIEIVARTKLADTTLIISLTDATDFQAVAEVISASARG